MLLLVVFLPLFSFLIINLFGRFIGTRGTYFIICLNMLLTSLISMNYYYYYIKYHFIYYIDVASWINLDLLDISWSFVFDSLSLTMLIVVALISTSAHIFSIDYMKDDPHQNRFLSYLSLFTFFMLILVTSNNLLQLFVGWEGVGLCSYLLINFWFNRFQSNKSAMKAMVVNKIGDIAYLIAIFVTFLFFKSLDFNVLYNCIFYSFNEFLIFFGFKVNLISFICFFFFLAAIGKSAQIGLHTWLPDAMEGPTPVSSLIHAATMVTAGIFLIIRTSFLFEFSSNVLMLIALFGSLTCFLASMIGIFQNDIKKIIAYSTCSQLGYMFFACGISSYNISIYHLFNHAFFKALLFLTSGSIIHILINEQDIRKMGGLFKLIPFSYMCIVVGSFSLMGVPFLSGFYSKDLIIELGFDYNHIISFYKFFFWICSFSISLSIIYSVKIIFYTFLNGYNGYFSVIKNLHKTSYFVILPLVFLSFASVFSGFFFKEVMVSSGNNFWLHSIYFHIENNFFNSEFRCQCIKLLPLQVTFYSFLILYFIGNFYSYIYIWNIKHSSLYRFFNHKLYIDLVYNNYFCLPLYRYAYSFFLKLFDKGFIELYGPYGIYFVLKNILSFFRRMEFQYIYHYCGSFLIGIIFFLVFLNQAIYYPLPYFDPFYRFFH